MNVLPDAEDSMIVSSFLSPKHRNVTDGRTDRQRDGQTDLPWLLKRSQCRRAVKSLHETLSGSYWPFKVPLYGITDNLFQRLQSIQNAATRLLTGTRQRDHISPVLSCLYWLPVKQRVVFKLAILVFKSLRGETPSYFADDCELITDSGRRCLRSADANALTVPRTYTRLGDRSFSVAAPKVWNSLPATLRKPNTEFVQFKRLLKAFLMLTNCFSFLTNINLFLPYINI